MRTVAILPIKRFARAKQRLRDALDDEPRTRLAEAMAGDVLEVLCGFDAFARVIVVTAEPVVDERATRPADRGDPRGARAGLITALALRGLPEVRPGDDLAALLGGLDAELRDGDVLAVAHKVVSKAEGRVVALESISPGRRALELAAQHGKDPRHMQVVLDEA